MPNRPLAMLAANCSFSPPSTPFSAALVQGFGWVLGYGGVSAWLFAAGSFLTFDAHRAARPRLEAVRS